MTIALDTGIGRTPAHICTYKSIYDLLLKKISVVHNVMGDAQSPTDPLSACYSCVLIGIEAPKLHGQTYHIEPLFSQQGSYHTAVHASAHSHGNPTHLTPTLKRTS